MALDADQLGLSAAFAFEEVGRTGTCFEESEEYQLNTYSVFVCFLFAAVAATGENRSRRGGERKQMWLSTDANSSWHLGVPATDRQRLLLQKKEIRSSTIFIAASTDHSIIRMPHCTIVDYST
eukprot:Nitzschia sp. Nitz4//scaffold261_size27179//5426//6141//NITZ4_008205-RA/size27179-snap-gene-0.0-mRNA-1//1//CDS//3329544705//1550//frame0